MMLAPRSLESGDGLSNAQLVEFRETTAVARKGYDKPHLENDA